MKSAGSKATDDDNKAAKLRLDADKSARFSASAKSTGWSDRLLRT
jgi:hypothetical protein